MKASSGGQSQGTIWAVVVGDQIVRTHDNLEQAKQDCVDYCNEHGFDGARNIVLKDEEQLQWYRDKLAKKRAVDTFKNRQRYIAGDREESLLIRTTGKAVGLILLSLIGFGFLMLINATTI